MGFGATSGEKSSYSTDDGTANCECLKPPDADVLPGQACGTGSGTAEAGKWIASGGQCVYEYPCRVDPRCSCYELGGDKYTAAGAGANACTPYGGNGCKGKEVPVSCTFNDDTQKCDCVQECWGTKGGVCSYLGQEMSLGSRDPCPEVRDDGSEATSYTIEQQELAAGACPGPLSAGANGAHTADPTAPDMDGNGCVDNRSASTLQVWWTDMHGSLTFPKNTNSCTAAPNQDIDHVKVGGRWYKVEDGHTLIVDALGRVSGDACNGAPVSMCGADCGK